MTNAEKYVIIKFKGIIIAKIKEGGDLNDGRLFNDADQCGGA